MTECTEGSTFQQDRTSSVTTIQECASEIGNVRSKDTSTVQKQKRCYLSSAVKAYIHHVHKNHRTQESSLFLEDDNQFLLPSHPRHQGCCYLWWKPTMCMGVIILLFGLLMILTGNLVPPLQVLIESSDNPNDPAFIDWKAEEYNTILGMWEFTGLILLCVGGVMIVISLFVPAFLIRFCQDRIDNPEAVNQRRMKITALNPLEVVVPVSSTTRDVHSKKLLNNQIETL